ncbi:MAG: prepilin-type N-terminal cleavage/methylation domain-containing protein [Sedimentisphaerales bacterium]|nr:prepilin-type N-terminal cleavage/methylation domain-containing protein [Sedimentisphaerales bacterium]
MAEIKNYELCGRKMKKAFTILELVVAVALLAMVFAFAAAIFQVGVNSCRVASANAEIMQKLRAITDQLNADFKGLQKDGYLLLRFDQLNRREFENSLGTNNFRADRVYYFSTGDFQSWFDSNVRSNIARIYFGHDSSFSDSSVPVNKWNLARDAVLLTPGNSPPPGDCNDLSFAECKVDLTGALEDPNVVLNNGVIIDIDSDPNDVRRLMCQNAGELRIEWTDGTITGGNLQWYGNPGTMEKWTPQNQADWPEALKFTFTLYDSKRILREGRVFTHIVYLEN